MILFFVSKKISEDSHITGKRSVFNKSGNMLRSKIIPLKGDEGPSKNGHVIIILCGLKPKHEAHSVVPDAGVSVI